MNLHHEIEKLCKAQNVTLVAICTIENGMINANVINSRSNKKATNTVQGSLLKLAKLISKEQMELSEKNIEKWKKNLDQFCKKIEYPLLSLTLSNEEWLNDYLGETPYDFLQNELSCAE